MFLSQPVFNHIRLDTDFSLLKGYHLIRCERGFHPFVSPPEFESDDFVIGARFTAVFYTDSVSDEVAGYLGEVASAILNYKNPNEDREMLLFFAKDIFNSFIDHLRKNLPGIDVNFVTPPDYQDIVDSWVGTLVKSGLY